MLSPSSRPLILASQSPRRVTLLREAGFKFTISVPEVEEAHDATLSPEELTVENARLKARAVSTQSPDSWVIGADTLVYLDGIPLGKPANREEAFSMLRSLSGRGHQVCTGVAILSEAGNRERTFHVLSEVIFKPLSDDVIHTYHEAVNPLDKAGGYGIQEKSEWILDRYQGSWTNIMGLPMERLKEELALLGVIP